MTVCARSKRRRPCGAHPVEIDAYMPILAPIDRQGKRRGCRLRPPPHAPGLSIREWGGKNGSAPGGIASGDATIGPTKWVGNERRKERLRDRDPLA